jgi:acyl-CoA synthetase (NDP forming)
MDQIEVSGCCRARAGSPLRFAYAYPRSAVRALGHAARYGCWRSAPPGHMAVLDGLRQERAAELVADFLTRPSRGGWLTNRPTAELLGCYGVPLADSIAVTTEDPALAAAARFAGPSALWADVACRAMGPSPLPVVREPACDPMDGKKAAPGGRRGSA